MNRRSLISLVVLLASLLLTAIATWSVAVVTQARDEARFVNAVQAARSRIEARLETYVALLRGGTGLFAAAEQVTYRDFRAYTDQLDLQRRYPGIQGFGFTKRVQPERFDSLAAAMRAAGFPDFQITPADIAGERHAIIYLEPLDVRNREAIGYDMFSDATRREAMARAWHTGAPAMSGKVRLVQEIEGPEQAGFLIYLPVYRGGDVPETDAERREALRGFVYAPFRADDLFAGIFGEEERPRVAFRIYDGPAVDPVHLLHDSRSKGVAPAADSTFVTTETLDVAGRTWTITFTETASLPGGFWNSSAPVVAVIGLIVSVLLFLLSRGQVRAEASLRESEHRLRTVLESLPVGVLVADASGKITFTNPAIHRIWQGEQAADDSSSMAAEADHRQFLNRGWGLQRALRGETTRGELVDVEARDGTTRTVLTSAFPLRDKAGRVRMAIAAVVDITEQRQAEEAMREREREFSTLANTIPQLAWMADEAGNVFWCNERWFDFTGTTLGEVQGRGWLRVHDPTHAERVARRFDEHVASGQPWEDLLPLRDRDGAYRWFLSMACPVRDERGRVLRWVGTHTDMTEQLKARQAEARAIREQAAREAAEAREDQLRLQAEELARSNRELQDFAYVASHDLQEPLRKITAFADLLQREYGPQFDEQGAFYIERMQRAATRMSRLIKDLLAFSRVTTRRQAFERVDLNEVMQDVRSDLGIRLHETRGRVEADDLPTVSADPVQMRQLFLNLVGNALKFHRPGEPPVVQVRCGRVQRGPGGSAGADEHWQIEVSDNGIGFDEKYLDRIFTPFQRLHTQAEYEGTGIGLAICRRIVERHGGVLTARSTRGEGSTFVVLLPVEEEEEVGG